MSDVITEPLHASYDMNYICINGHREDETDDNQSVEKINNIILLCEKVQKDVLSQPLPHCSSLMLEKLSPKISTKQQFYESLKKLWEILLLVKDQVTLFEEKKRLIHLSSVDGRLQRRATITIADAYFNSVGWST